jgi:hypothetical protein
MFVPTPFSSSRRPTQFADAVQRAEFFHAADEDWHTMLRPRVRTARNLVLLRGTYQFALNPDGTCCFFVLIDVNGFVKSLFPATPDDTTTPVGAAENTGDITTRISRRSCSRTPSCSGARRRIAASSVFTPTTSSRAAANGWREKRYVLNYSSWVSPGIFRDPTFGDITALSHEISEIFNDPFVNNTTPWWLAPNGLCQNNLEDGDVIEGLPNAQIAITVNGFTYHPQNEALLQWFAGVSPSSAIDQAYSYPDTTILTTAAVPRKPGCKA